MVNCTHNNNAANCQAQGVNPDQKSQLEGTTPMTKTEPIQPTPNRPSLCSHRAAKTSVLPTLKGRRGWSKKVGHVS